MRILAISGSLRKASLNTKLLRLAIDLAPKAVEIGLCHSLGTLPLFNPDLEGSEPGTVLTFQKQVASADAVLIASPEYAHGVTGVIKNALDWDVGSGTFSGKPVAVLNAAERAHHAWDALKETLTVMDANIIEEACAIISLTGNEMTLAQMKKDPTITDPLSNAIAILATASKAKPNE